MSSTRARTDRLLEPFIVCLREGLIVSPWANEVSPGDHVPIAVSLSCLSLSSISLLVDTQSQTCKIGASGGSSCAKLCSPWSTRVSPVSFLWSYGSPFSTHDASHCPSDGVLLEWTPVWCGVIVFCSPPRLFTSADPSLLHF